MKNYFRFDEKNRAIHQMLLGNIDAEFVTNAIREVQLNSNYDTSVDWLIDLSIFEATDPNDFHPHLERALLDLSVHTGKCAIIVDRQYSTVGDAKKPLGQNVQFYISKRQAITHLQGNSLASRFFQPDEV